LIDHWFYHLESATIKGVLPALLEKSIARGWSVLIKMDAADMNDMDNFLWTYRDESFLPHGRDDEPQADTHPIRLSATATAADGADVVFIIDGSEVDELKGVSRCIFLINGRNQEAVTQARQRWSRLKKTKASLSYFQQNERGVWEKKA